MRISRQSAQFWKCQRYHFVTAYESKPWLAPPFVIFSHIYMIVKYLIRLCQRKKIKFDRKLKAFLSDDMIQRLHDFEENCFYEYNCEMELSLSNTMEEKINQTRDKVESISARLDDIFFKENVTKLSLYKVELRLQKLEELNYEAINQLSSIYNLLRINNKSDNNLEDVAENDLFADSIINKRSRKRTVTISDTNQLIYQDEGSKNIDDRLTRSLLRLNRFNRSISSQSSQTSAPNKLQIHRNSSVNSNEATTTTTTDNKLRHRKRVTSDTTSSIAHTDIEPNDDKKLMHQDSSIEKKYLKKVSKKIANNEEIMNLDEEFSTSSSSSSSSEINMNITAIKRNSQEKPVIRNEEIVVEIDSNENNVTKKVSSNQLIQSQMIGLEQYTIHPFVYLPTVVRPPIAEYTSITDCIDTSTIDRPPSPPVSTSIANKYNVFFSNQNDQPSTFSMTSSIKESKNPNLKEYCSGESARSIVARQESEILRLAEESQHVIINQLLNNIVKKSDSPSLKQKSSKNNKTKEKDTLLSTKKIKPSLTKTSTIDETNDEEPLIENNQMQPSILLNEENETIKKTETQANKKNKKNDHFALSFTSSSSSSHTPISILHDDSTLSPKNDSAIERIKLLPLSSTAKIPLNPIDRKSSQIFYAQSQANALCLHIDDDDTTETSSNKLKGRKEML